MSDDLEQCDVAIIGAGVAGALLAYRLAAANHRVVVLEAGPVTSDRRDLVAAYALAAIKTPRSPYLDNQPPSPVASPDTEKDYLQGEQTTPFKSTYLRRVGGTTWHMLGNTPRHVPADFRLATTYGVGVDWPLDYRELEPWYSEAEWELGVSGDHDELNNLHDAYRSRPFPMTKIWPAYGDIVVAKAIRGLRFDGVDVRLTTTPQARNSRPYDGRPACAGNSSCVPLCPIGAKYDGTVHVGKAKRAGADIRECAVVTRIELDKATRRVQGLRYVRWDPHGQVERRLQASVYVLAGHAVESPRLLLVSKDADTAPNGVANGSDQVGRNLMDHLQGQAAAIVAEPLFPYRGPPTTVGVDEFRDGSFRKTHAAFRLSIGNDGMGRVESPFKSLEMHLASGLIGSRLRTALGERLIRQFRISYSTEMLPRVENRVTLAEGPPDQFGMSRAMLTMHLDDYNKRAFEKAAALISQIFDRLDAPIHERKPNRKTPTRARGTSWARRAWEMIQRRPL